MILSPTPSEQDWETPIPSPNTRKRFKRAIRSIAISLFVRKTQPTEAMTEKNPKCRDVSHAPPTELWRMESPVVQLTYHQIRLAETAAAIPHFLPQNRASTKMGTA